MTRHRRFAQLFIVVALSCIARPSKGATIVINFENLPDMTVLSTQYASLTFVNAITLTSGVSLNEFQFPPHSGVGVISDSGGPITISFLTPVTGFSGFFTYSTQLKIQAFDIHGGLVGSAVSAFSNNLACLDGPPCSGDSGSSPNELLELSFTSGIDHVIIAGDAAGSSFVADDVHLTSVPEPSSLLLWSTGLCVIIFKKYSSLFKKHMNVRLLWVSAGTAATLLACVWLFSGLLGAQPQMSPANPLAVQQRIGAASLSPTAIDVGTASPVTISVSITDAALIPGSVNLLRLNANGSAAVIGTLQRSSDNLYTLQPIFQEPQTGSLRLQVSAAFRGALQRVLSNVVILSVLPPDPGIAGTATVQGIDSDHDGIRDDVQRWVALAQPQSIVVQLGLGDHARATQDLLTASTTRASVASGVLLKLLRANECLSYLIPSEADRELLLSQLSTVEINTEARLFAWTYAEDAIGGQVVKASDNRKASCSFNPDLVK